MTMPLAPPDSSAPSISPDAFLKAFDDAIGSAQTQREQAKAALDAANAKLAAVRPGVLGDDDRKAAETEVQHASTVLEAAAANESRQHELKGAAIDRYVQKGNISPGLTAHYQALADSETAAAAKTKAETAEWVNAAPDRAAQLHATTQETTANANLSQAKAALADATLPAEIQKAQLAVQQAQAGLESTQAANKSAGLANTILAAKAGVAPRVEAAAASTAESGATVAGAQAGTATQTAAAALQTAQTGADQAALDLKNAQAQYDATSPEMRTGALQASLDQAQAQVAQSQQALQLAQRTQDTTVAQGQATLAGTTANTAATEAGTQKGLLGPLYGATAKAKEIADMLRSGQLGSGPDAETKAHQMLQDYITTAMRGTTPYQMQSDALTAETQRRQQDYSLAGQQGSTYGSALSSGMNTFQKLNDTTPVGSDSAGRGFLAYEHMLRQGLGSFTPQGNAPMSPLLQSMSTGGGVGPPATPAPAAQTTIAPDGTVTIAHTPAAPSITAPLLPAGAAGTNADPNVAGSPAQPAMLSGMSPALPHHVDQLWANDPNLHAQGGV